MLTEGELKKIRDNFRPSKFDVPLKAIFIAESPPVNGNFFYDNKSKTDLFLNLTKAVGIESENKGKQEVLTDFAKKGYFLIDASYVTLQGLVDELFKVKKILDDYPKFKEDLISLEGSEKINIKEIPIILIKKTVYIALEALLKQDGFKVTIEKEENPRFPIFNDDPSFIAKIKELLKTAGLAV